MAAPLGVNRKSAVNPTMSGGLKYEVLEQYTVCSLGALARIFPALPRANTSGVHLKPLG